MSTDLSRLGYHYFADEAHYTQRDLNAWLPILKGLEAHWVILRGSLKRSIPESFVRALIDHSILPIIHIPAKVGDPKESEIFPLLQTYSKWGIKHVVIGDKPNMKESWAAEDWSKSGIVERFVDIQLPILKAQYHVGLHPILPPLQPGGDYWDTTFLMNLLHALRRRADEAVLASLRLSVYAWTYGHPLDWGKGGPVSWPDTRPYLTPIGAEDQKGIRITDWYQAIAEKALGKQLPMIVIAGGPGPIFSDFGLSEVPTHTVTLDILRSLIAKEIPTYVENFAFYILSSNAKQEAQELAWYRNPRSPNPVAEAVKGFLQTSINRPDIPTDSGIKSFTDYFLLAPDLSTEGVKFNDVLKQAGEQKAAIGFAMDEACKAQNVFLIGFTPSASVFIKQRLQQAGCNVHNSPLIERVEIEEVARFKSDFRFDAANQPGR
jgi:hypothetical protein